jgi:hypothetical protein
MPTIIVEDGSGITDANSYVTVAELQKYCDDRGFVLPNLALEVMIIKAMDYIEAQADRFQGYIGNPFQRLQWPRLDVYINGFLVPSDVIPEPLKKAQMQLALEVAKGVDLMPTSSGQFVVREKVGPIETQYSESVGTGSQPSLTAVDAIMACLFGASGSFLSLRRV